MLDGPDASWNALTAPSRTAILETASNHAFRDCWGGCGTIEARAGELDLIDSTYSMMIEFIPRVYGVDMQGEFRLSWFVVHWEVFDR